MTYTTDEIRTMLDETKHLGDGQFPIPRNVAAIAITQAEEIERLRELLQLWDDLINHQYSGSREAMSDMTYIAQATAAALKEPKP